MALDSTPGYHILIHYGEVGLKRKNQPAFRTLLQRNIHQSLKHHGYRLPVRQTRGYLSVDLTRISEVEHQTVLDLIGQTFGIIWYTKAVRFRYKVPADPDLAEIKARIEDLILTMIKHTENAERSFCVRVRRSDKRFPVSSTAYERELGTFIRARSNLDKVDLTDPDLTYYIEIQSGEIYIYDQKLPGRLGLPVGSAGRVLAMLSGGIDSPVAAYLSARRGCKLDFIHFTASHISRSEAEEQKIAHIVRQLSRFTIRSRLFLVPYTYFQLALTNKKVPFELVLFRRFMVRVAEKVSYISRAKALVTGDNLSQVASQTIWNIASMVAVVHRPILQPLITYEKQEIIQLAREIDTYELSLAPYKDCCSLISRNPNVASKSSELTRIEAEVFSDYQKVVTDSVNDMITLEFRFGQPVRDAE
jgi:thiamine biosynthesis protein ThiI